MGCNIQKHQYTKNDIIISSPPPTFPSSHEIIMMPYALDEQHPASRMPVQIHWNIKDQKSKEQSSEITTSFSPNTASKPRQY
ncbi:unnamed protein product (macronuclear) [Paramecium tetraurelia]|uniref:Uncharacterized protein n=1 Tax=Paramecium tetraurelia TaxID=5888 RepID=A0BJ46_PARTE|nr:uncharacterized protein GSPATT00004936001 [Paramecium tetraurelia]CAK58563.1 unnamed protein product [Paramecium tetraurelia]|eukprot:XP_001425961.1 hypothetical protein (macronuclear) [Paramecium tetraurelia strain d4-2]